MNYDPTIKNLGIQPHVWNHMYMLLPLIVQNKKKAFQLGV